MSEPEGVPGAEDVEPRDADEGSGARRQRGRSGAFLRRTGISTETQLLVLAATIGAGGGVAAWGLRYLISRAEWLFLDVLVQPLESLGVWKYIIPPALGGLIVGPLVDFLAPEAKGHGVPEAMAAVSARGGRIRGRVAWTKALAAATSIGSGGSVGREGPIAHISSAIGSFFGQRLRMSESRLRTCAVCGAAAGTAATFNTPLAGALFAMEVIAGGMASAVNAGAVLVAAFTGAFVGQALLGDKVTFEIGAVPTPSGEQYFLFVALGLLACAVVWLYVRSLYQIEDAFERIRRVPQWVLPSIGGALVGGCGALTLYLTPGFDRPPVFGVGYEGIEQALTGGIGLQVVGLLIFVKILATSLTIGSGGSGGVFAPSLFLGSILGFGVGEVAQRLFPYLDVNTGTFAAVGMAAVLSGAAFAPVTAVVILTELTHSYELLLPLLLACGISAGLSKRLLPDSIYGIKLRRSDVRLPGARESELLDRVFVRSAMDTHVESVNRKLPCDELESMLRTADRRGYPVVDEAGRLCGIVTLSDVHRVSPHQHLEDLLVEDIMTERVLVAHPNETLTETLHRFGWRDVGQLPVVDPADEARLVGVITRRDIMTAFELALVRRQRSLRRLSEMHRHTK